ncbi:heterokaryon incompatibility protein-domain-containing protein [Hypoxylon crocopeplum]|nr:heterokaryon incompatibility protein-domain-containing protein [Hypoxylon crocopeplum]
MRCGDQANEPFLFEPTGPSAYACLSYCWGEDAGDVLKTTVSNLDAHYKEIPLRSMPRSLQDAVRVCRGLGIPYLWVDSLCTLQDDYDEWLEDASMMDRIYLNSHVTIAALEPSSCKTGFLGKQKFGVPGWQHRLKVRCTTPEVVREDGTFDWEESIKIHYAPQEAVIRPHYTAGIEKLSGKLQARTRELSLGKLGALIKGELSAPVLVPKQDVDGDRYLEWLTGSSSTATRGEAGRPGRIHELWRMVVANYSRRSLSRRSDKLIALAGLANLVHENVQQAGGDTKGYLFGLWKSELHFDLCWMAVSNGSSDTVDQDRLFPSWSWASCDKPIRYDFTYPLVHWDPAPLVVDQCLFRGVEAMPGKGSRLRLEGKLVPVEMVSYGDHLTRFDVLVFDTDEAEKGLLANEIALHGELPMGSKVDVYFDRSTDPAISLFGDQAYCWVKSKSGERRSQARGPDDTESGYYCFRLFSWSSPTLAECVTWFLVLRSSRHVERAFERIGVGVWDDHQHTSFCPLFETTETGVVDIV